MFGLRAPGRTRARGNDFPGRSRRVGLLHRFISGVAGGFGLGVVVVHLSVAGVLRRLCGAGSGGGSGGDSAPAAAVPQHGHRAARRGVLRRRQRARGSHKRNRRRIRLQRDRRSDQRIAGEHPPARQRRARFRAVQRGHHLLRRARQRGLGPRLSGPVRHDARAERRAVRRRRRRPGSTRSTTCATGASPSARRAPASNISSNRCSRRTASPTTTSRRSTPRSRRRSTC